MSRGYAWLDTGTHSNLLDAGTSVRPLQRQGLQVGCPEEIAFKNGWIGVDQLLAAGSGLTRTAYGKYLIRLAESAMN